MKAPTKALALPRVWGYNPRFRAVRQGMPSCFCVDPGICNKCHFSKEENEMPKLKTKSSAKKRFRLTGTGKVRANVANKQHGMSKRPQKMKRKARGTMILADADARLVKSYMPYA